MLAPHIIAFTAYSLGGAILEHMSYAVARLRTPPHIYRAKALLNPILTGFPLYGIGAYSVVALHNTLGVKRAPWPVQFVAYAAALSALEYAVGRWVVGAGSTGNNNMTASGMIESWDYGGGSIVSIVSPRHFVQWGILAMLVTHCLHPALMRMSRAAIKAM